MSPARLALRQSVLVFLGVSSLNAQDLSELCPDARSGTGAVIGIVSDIEAQMALPGATVLATWAEDGTSGRAETVTGLDGSFTMCHLPLETDVALQASFATLAGEAVSLSLTERITRQDIEFSLSGSGSGARDDDVRMWLCIGRPDSEFRLELGNFVRCDPQWQPLERCAREDLGRVSARASSARRSELKEMLDTMIEDARRLGANALVDFSGDRDSINANAVKIDVDPRTC